MKIIGFVHTDLGAEMVLKGDSCLLNGRKPFFVPEGSSEIGVTDCIILRVSRLGKGIAQQFAHRYYDAIAWGADFTDLEALRIAREEGKPWTKAIAFDYSLAIGPWMETNEIPMHEKGWVMGADAAIVRASEVMTIRQGDLITIQAACAPRKVEKEEIIQKEIAGEQKLYCKIK